MPKAKRKRIRRPKVLYIRDFPGDLLGALKDQANAQEPPVSRNNWIIHKLREVTEK